MEQNVQEFLSTGKLSILKKDIFPIWSIKNAIPLKDKVKIGKRIQQDKTLFKIVQNIITEQYHDKSVCGEKNIKNWAEYNKCDNGWDSKEYQYRIDRAKKCIHLRKILWFIINLREYPYQAKHLKDDESHIKPIKENEEYLKNCESYYRKLEKYNRKINDQKKEKLMWETIEKKAIEKANEMLKELLKKQREKKNYGKEKHPISGKMVNKCAPDKERNPVTGNCRKKCTSEQEVDSKTGRCVKKCKPGQTRDPKTGRCKKN